MVQNKDSAKNPDRHDRCPSCQYEDDCNLFLRLAHALGWPCRQGRKRKVLRQATLDEVPDPTFEEVMGAS